MLLGKFGFEFLNFQMNRERQKVEFDAPKSFCSVFFSVSYDQLRLQNQNVGLSFVWIQPATGIQYSMMQVRITIQSKAQGCDFQKALALYPDLKQKQPLAT